MSKAHVLGTIERTQDVKITEEVTFEGLILSDSTLKGLSESGFESPSPIQLVAIPLGKCGFDLIAEAKSGTGKTVMFGVIALEMLELPSKSLQVLILTPTREIAAQVGDVLTNIGQGFNGLKLGVFIGGLPVEEDKRRAKSCHIAVGTPGRLKHLLNDQLLDVSHIKLVIIDEADKLLEPSFQPDINHIFRSLPINKQVIAASATYTPELKKFLEDYMRSPIRVNPQQTNAERSMAVLLGVRQVASLVPFHPNYLTKFKNKLDALVSILSCVPFKQCIVFNNSHGVAQTISETLNSKGWPTEFLSSSMDQPTRLKVMNRFYEYKCRVLLSTDLVSRGIDVANVNLVINLDVPMVSDTYLHRVGRSGRFGTQGLAITIVEDESKDLIRLADFLQELDIPMDCVKISAASPLKDNLFSCPLPTLLSEVSGFLEKESSKVPLVRENGDSLHAISNDAENEQSSSSDLEEIESDSESGADLPPEICKVIESEPQNLEPESTDLEKDLCKELAEMHLAQDSMPRDTTTPEKVLMWQLHNSTPPPNQKGSPVRRLPFSSPNSRQSSEYSPQREFSPYSPQRREYSHNSNQSSPQREPWSPRKQFSTSSYQTSPQREPWSPKREFSPNSSQHSTPRKNYGFENNHFRNYSVDKFVFYFSKFKDESIVPDLTQQTFNPQGNYKQTSSSNQQYHQQLFEIALKDLLKEVVSYHPPRMDPILGYNGLEAACNLFKTSAASTPVFERREPYFNRKAVILGMGKHLGVLCNVTKRHFAYNGGVKNMLNKLADGFEPKEADLPPWEPGLEGFRVNHIAWVHGNEYVEECRKAQLAALEQKPAAPQTPQPPPAAPKQQPLHKAPAPQIAFHPTEQLPHAPFGGAQWNGDHLTLSQPPSEHHTLKFPSFPTEPGASLAEWKEQVKLTTFMIHYAEYFRMMNKK